MTEILKTEKVETEKIENSLSDLRSNFENIGKELEIPDEINKRIILGNIKTASIKGEILDLNQTNPLTGYEKIGDYCNNNLGEFKNICEEKLGFKLA